MAFNEEWNRKRSSFCTGILAVIPDPIHTRISTTILPTFCIFIFGKMELEAPYFWSLPQTPKFLGFWVLRFRSRVLSFWDFGVFVFDLGCFVFEFWVLRFRDLGASFSSFGCFVFEFWVLRFRDLGVFVFDLGCFVFEIWVLCASVFFFECFVFETTICKCVISVWWANALFQVMLYSIQ